MSTTEENQEKHVQQLKGDEGSDELNEVVDSGETGLTHGAVVDDVKPIEETKEGEEDEEEREAAAAPVEEDHGEPILEPMEHDILNGRGASVNAHRGNTKFRALCFARKPEFEAGNHAAKRRVAAEIVSVTKALPGRFLKRKQDKGPWYEVGTEKAILKACQVMRDFQRPDRLALREMATANGGRKRQRTSESTPGVNAPVPAVPLAPIVENPYGVHDHDVLSGRGAFVNGHIGNERFRQLAIDRKPQFDAGNYSEKRALATEVVGIIRSLNPPGRFLRRVTGSRPIKPATNEEGWSMQPRGLDGGWEELSDDRAIHKACQVMRDLNRPDRAAEKKSGFSKDKDGVADGEDVDEDKEEEGDGKREEESAEGNDSMEVATATEATAVEEAVMATEQVLDKALADAVPGHPSGEEETPEEEKEQVEMMQV